MPSSLPSRTRSVTSFSPSLIVYPPPPHLLALLALLVALLAFAACAVCTSCGVLGLLAVSVAGLSRRWERYGSTSVHLTPLAAKYSDVLRSVSSASEKVMVCEDANHLMTVDALPEMRTGTDSPVQLARFARSTAARLVSSAACALQAGQMTSRPTASNGLPHFVQNFFMIDSPLCRSRGNTNYFCLSPWDKSILV